MLYLVRKQQSDFVQAAFNFWKLNKGKLRGLFVPCNTTSISERKV